MLKKLSYILVACATASSAFSADLDKPFHKPGTEAEKAIETILILHTKVINSAPLYYYLTGYKPSGNDAYYATLFTKPFRDSIMAANQAALNANCGGKYIEGEDCGLAANPIDCTSDMNDAYLFRTEVDTGSMAIVDYTWPGMKRILGRYKLIHTTQGWKLDGVSCSQDINFHWGDGK